MRAKSPALLQANSSRTVALMPATVSGVRRLAQRHMDRGHGLVSLGSRHDGRALAVPGDPGGLEELDDVVNEPPAVLLDTDDVDGVQPDERIGGDQ
ncbi:MAG: hypothetical protein M3Q71_18055 [Chloroflexota bacterium]|nr:hypothetical protein [Chloroflexota bacterium]